MRLRQHGAGTPAQPPLTVLQLHIAGPELHAQQLAHIACVYRDNGRDDLSEYMFRRSLLVMETAAGHSGLGVCAAWLVRPCLT